MEPLSINIFIYIIYKTIQKLPEMHYKPKAPMSKYLESKTFKIKKCIN